MVRLLPLKGVLKVDGLERSVTEREELQDLHLTRCRPLDLPSRMYVPMELQLTQGTWARRVVNSWISAMLLDLKIVLMSSLWLGGVACGARGLGDKPRFSSMVEREGGEGEFSEMYKGAF